MAAATTDFAFSIALEDFPAWEQKLKSKGIAVESIVKWPQSSQSLYFRDPDNHLAELITPGFCAHPTPKNRGYQYQAQPPHQGKQPLVE